MVGGGWIYPSAKRKALHIAFGVRMVRCERNGSELTIPQSRDYEQRDGSYGRIHRRLFGA